MRISIRIREMYVSGVAPSVAAHILNMRRADILREYGALSEPRKVHVSREDRRVMRAGLGLYRDLDGATNQVGIALDYSREYAEIAEIIQENGLRKEQLDDKYLKRLGRAIRDGSGMDDADKRAQHRENTILRAKTRTEPKWQNSAAVAI